MIVSNTIAVLLYFASVFLIMRSQPRYAVFFGLFSLMHGWALVSCFYNDLGVFNIELFNFTEPSLATTRLALFCLVFNAGFWLTARLLQNRPLRRIDYSLSGDTLLSGNIRLIGWFLIIILVAYVGHSLVTGGIPLLSGMDRLSYFQHSSPLIKKIFIYGPFLAFLLGYYHRSNRLWSPQLLLMLLFILFGILTGNKFSFLLLLITPFVTPLYARYISRERRGRIITARSLRWTALAVAVFLVLAFGSYSMVMSDTDMASAYLFNRVFAFQGEVWWTVDNHVTTSGRYDSNHLDTEIDCLLAPENCPEAATGLRYLMVNILGPDRAFPIIDRGYLYTMAWPAILIATFPFFWALIAQLLAGIGYCFLLYYLHHSLVYNHAVRSIIAMLIVIPYTALILSGNFQTFFTLGMVGKGALLLIGEMGLVGGQKNTRARTEQPASIAG
jgi:hypothetical protein